MPKKIKETYAYTKELSINKKRNKKFYWKLFISLGIVVISAVATTILTIGIKFAKDNEKT